MHSSGLCFSVGTMDDMKVTRVAASMPAVSPSINALPARRLGSIPAPTKHITLLQIFVLQPLADRKLLQMLQVRLVFDQCSSSSACPVHGRQLRPLVVGWSRLTCGLGGKAPLCRSQELYGLMAVRSIKHKCRP